MSVHSFCRRIRPAQGTQRLAPLVRNNRYRIDRRPRLTRKEWVRPGLSAEPPAEHPAEQEPQKDQLGRVGRRFTHSVLAESCAPWRAKDVIRLWRIKGLHEHADKRKGRGARVAEGRVAAFCVSAIEPLGRQPQSFDLVLPLGEAQRGGRDLNTIAAAPVIEEIGAADLMRIGLAVIATADHAIDRPRRRIGDDAPYLAATATYLNLSAHGEPLGYSRNRPLLGFQLLPFSLRDLANSNYAFSASPRSIDQGVANQASEPIFSLRALG